MNSVTIISIVNQKGGVGKSTTAMNLATALCAMKMKTLMIDLDPQANATSGLGISIDQIKYSSYDVIIGNYSLKDSVVNTYIPYLDVLPSTIDLAGAEIELVSIDNKEYALLNSLTDIEQYDYIIIDCPPSLGLLTINALVASHELIVPLQCEYFALEGLSHLVKTVNSIQNSWNKVLRIKGIVLTMYDGRNNLSKMISEDVRNYYKDLVYETVIPRNVKVSEAPSHGYPVLMYDPKCAGSEAYINLAAEVMQQDKKYQR